MAAMDRERFARIAALFAAAEGLPAEQWAALLAQQAPDDADLQREVLAMLQVRRSESGDSFLAVARGAARDLEQPVAIGPYRIVRELGSGGMGIVYLAEQREPVARQVALKVVKLGMDSRAVLARFDAERQALARMQSDSIAKVFDAGITAEGRPYFVMEYVDGVPLSLFCDEHRLSLEARIRLFQQVCEGVQHAHQKGVIHRDLKPGNILVTVASGSPTAKIIDFGIARAVEHGAADGTLLTLHGQMLGTLEYMSPEQAGLPGVDVDTRSDVYSLGVVLYELLAGELPFASTELRQRGLAEIQRVIREQEPPKPSSRVSTRGDETAARNRRLHGSTLHRRLRGELDWITMRALEKDRRRRYASPRELAADLDRFLRTEPVTAGPPSVTYRLTKFLRRNRVAVGAGAAVVATAVVGLGMAIAQRDIAVTERERHLGGIRQQIASSTARLDTLHTEDRWPAAPMQRALDDLDAAMVAAREARAVGGPAFGLEIDNLEETALGWHRDVAFFAAMDRAILAFRYGSDAAHEWRIWRRGLKALRQLGIDLASDGGASWQHLALQRLEQTHLRSLALLTVNAVRNTSAFGEDARTYPRATDLLSASLTGDRRALYTGRWGNRTAAARELLARVTATIDDPIEASYLVPHLEQIGMLKERDAMIDRLSLARPGHHFAVLMQMKREWASLLPKEVTLTATQVAASARARIEAMAQTLQATSPDLRTGWIYRLRLLTIARDPNAEAACRETLRRFPDDPVALFYLAEDLKERGHDAEARDAYYRTIASEPAYVEAYLPLLQVTSPDEQFRLLQMATAADPWHETTVLQLAGEHVRRGAWRDAIAVLAPLLGNKGAWRIQAIYPLLEQAAVGLGDRTLAATSRRIRTWLEAAGGPRGTAVEASFAPDTGDLGTEAELQTACRLMADGASGAPADGEAAAWDVVERAVAGMRERAASAPLAVYLELQLWQARSPLRERMGQLLGRIDADAPLTGIDVRGAAVTQSLVDLRNTLRPQGHPTGGP